MPYKNIEDRKKWSRKYYKKNKIKILKNRKKREKEKPEIYKKIYKKYRDLHKNEIKIRIKKWKDKNKKKVANYSKLYRKKYPKKIYAQRKAERKIKIESVCFYCNTNKKLERHHPDYDLPLYTITICKQCHSNIHNGGKLKL